MATSYEYISTMLEEMDINYEATPIGIITGTSTQNYVNPQGENLLKLLIELQEDGEFFKLEALRAYNCDADHPNLKAVMQTLLGVNFFTKALQWEYNQEDGEIRAVIEFPLEDANMTYRQIGRIIQAMVQLIERYHAPIMGAIETGEVSLSVKTRKSEILQHLIQRLKELQDQGED